jgi:hypothetical protein
MIDQPVDYIIIFIFLGNKPLSDTCWICFLFLVKYSNSILMLTNARCSFWDRVLNLLILLIQKESQTALFNL